MEVIQLLNNLRGSLVQLTDICGDTFDHLMNQDSSYQTRTENERVYSLFSDYENCVEELSDLMNKGDEISLKISSNLSNFKLELETGNNSLDELESYIKE